MEYLTISKIGEILQHCTWNWIILNSGRGKGSQKSQPKGSMFEDM